MVEQPDEGDGGGLEATHMPLRRDVKAKLLREALAARSERPAGFERGEKLPATPNQSNTA